MAKAPKFPHISSSDQTPLRYSGIEVVGDVAWGTHFCEFYDTRQDLLDTLVPYFHAGLIANEYCMWVTSAPLEVDQALEAMHAADPDFQRYLDSGQIEILDYSQWYLYEGVFEADRVLNGWQKKLAEAQIRGFEGLRLTGNTFWLERATWDDFTRYEAKVNEALSDKQMIALCTYCLSKCSAHEILDVLTNHQFALIKTAGRWDIIETPQHVLMENALRESEQRYHSLFTQMNEGFALHEIICDDYGKPIDYRFLDVNPAFQQFTGFSRDQVVGRTVREILPDIEDFWIDTYGEVALTGKPVHFQNFSGGLGKYYDVMAFSPRSGQFAVLFIDISERKQLEEQARDAAAHIKLQHRLNVQREQERLQIARELHDGPIQELSSILYSLQSVILNIPEKGIKTQLEDIRRLLGDQITYLRAFSQELRPPILIQFGLARAVKAHIENFKDKHPAIEVDLDAGLTDVLPETVQHGLYRILQEALNNIARHANASKIVVELRTENNTLTFSIQDNGVGFTPPKDWLDLTAEGHLGLVGIRERADMMGGKAEISSQPGVGTRLLVTIPISG